MADGNMRGHEAGGLKKKIVGGISTVLIFIMFLLYMIPFITLELLPFIFNL